MLPTPFPANSHLHIVKYDRDGAALGNTRRTERVVMCPTMRDRKGCKFFVSNGFDRMRNWIGDTPRKEYITLDTDMYII